MTNTELQSIGIDEAAFSAATEEQRVFWAKANTTAGLGLCRQALEWLSAKSSDIVIIITGGAANIGLDNIAADRFIYRLAPDYQPPGKRWWFHVSTGAVRSYDEVVDLYGWIAITAEYAAYLQAKPEPDAELRKPERGDVYLVMEDDGSQGIWTIWDCGLNIAFDQHRWCKSRKVAGWVEYEVAPVNGVYCVRLCNGSTWRLDKAANRVGFGGVQFEGLDGWHMATRKLKGSHGVLCDIALPSDDQVPAVPVRCRFWEIAKDS
jgi:hypothetical protein